MAIRVLVVDDRPTARFRLRVLVATARDLEVVGEAASGEEAIAQLPAAAPDVVLMDLQMGGIGGLEATRRIALRWPDVRVLVLTVSDDSAREAFAAGASGYVPKDASDAEVAEAIRALAAGGRYLYPSLGAELAMSTGGPTQRRPRGVALTERELSVLRLVALGHSNREVAAELGISVRTVESHRTHITQKTGARTRAELVRYATEAGVLPAR